MNFFSMSPNVKMMKSSTPKNLPRPFRQMNTHKWRHCTPVALMKNFISYSSIFRCGATAGLDLLTIFLHWLLTVASTLPVMTTLVIRDTDTETLLSISSANVADFISRHMCHSGSHSKWNILAEVEHFSLVQNQVQLSQKCKHTLCYPLRKFQHSSCEPLWARGDKVVVGAATVVVTCYERGQMKAVADQETVIYILYVSVQMVLHVRKETFTYVPGF